MKENTASLYLGFFNHCTAWATGRRLRATPIDCPWWSPSTSPALPMAQVTHQPTEAVSPCLSSTTAVLVPSSSQPFLAQPWALPSWAHPRDHNPFLSSGRYQSPGLKLSQWLPGPCSWLGLGWTLTGKHLGNKILFPFNNSYCADISAALISSVPALEVREKPLFGLLRAFF